MASSAVQDCLICEDEFNENSRCPRILPCSHCFCTYCIKQLIDRDDRKCPLCRQTFNATSAGDLKINRLFLDSLSYIKDLEVKYKTGAKGSITHRSKIIKIAIRENEEINCQNILRCQEAEDQINDAIQRSTELKCKIINNHIKFKCDIMNKIKENETKCDMEAKFLDERNDILWKRLHEIRVQKQKMNDIKNSLSEAKTLQNVDTVADEVEKADKAVKTWLKEFRMFMSRMQTVLQGVEKNERRTGEKIEVIKGILATSEEDVNNLSELLEALTLQTERQGQLKLENMSPEVKYLVSLGGIYAVLQHGERRKSARISISEDKLLLHCLTEEKPPSNVCTIEHKKTMELVNPSFRLSFLEFGTDESSIGRVFVSTSSDSKRAENFAALCSGEKGPTYKNTFVIEVGNKSNAGENIRCGNYVNTSRHERESMVPGAGEERHEDFRRPCKAGLVAGIDFQEHAAQFMITTRDDPIEILNPVFGRVESGLHVLRKAISLYPDIKKVKIIDCGIALPLSALNSRSKRKGMGAIWHNFIQKVKEEMF